MGSNSRYKNVEQHGKKIRITFFINGKRKRRTLDERPTQAGYRRAAQKLKLINDDLERGTYDHYEHFPDDKKPELEDKTPTFGELAEQYLELNANRLRASTINGYRKKLYCYWMKPLADKKITEIKPTHIKKVLAKMSHLKGKTINDSLTPVRAIFEDAYIDDIISFDPTTKIKPFPHQKPLPDPLSTKEMSRVLWWLGEYEPSWLPYFKFAFNTGLRPSEMLALKWSDISEGVATIQRTRTEGQNWDTTKTNEIRLVDLNNDALSAISGKNNHDWVFIHPRTKRQINNDKPPRLIWTRALKELGIRHRPAYNTRHSYATMMIMTGYKVMYVSEQMGHANMQMTLTRYAKWIRGGADNMELKADDDFLLSIVDRLRTEEAQKLLLAKVRFQR